MSRFRRIVVFWLLVLQNTMVWAGPVPDDSGIPNAPLPRSNRSEVNRQSREMGFTTGVSFRGGMSVFVEAGAEFAFFSQPNELLTIRLSQLSASEERYHFSGGGTSFSEDIQYLNMNGGALSVNWKNFLSNSFYIKLGLEQLKLKGEYRDEAGIPRLHLGDLSRQNALFAIGNQWQWKVFTMGCDWGGLTFPLAYRYDSYHDEIDTDLANDFAKLGNQTLANFLYFYVGASF